MLFYTILEHSIDSALNVNLYLVLTPWLLMALVLTNAYKSLITFDLIAPKHKVLLQDFEQLVSRGYTIYVRPSPGLLHKYNHDLNKEFKWKSIYPMWQESDLYSKYLGPVFHIIEQEYHMMVNRLDEKRRERVSQGSVSLWNATVGWRLIDVNEPRIRPRMRRITEAGIVDFWRGLDAYVKIHHIYHINT